jgi:hypothetical protein
MYILKTCRLDDTIFIIFVELRRFKNPIDRISLETIINMRLFFTVLVSLILSADYSFAKARRAMQNAYDEL